MFFFKKKITKYWFLNHRCLEISAYQTEQDHLLSNSLEITGAAGWFVGLSEFKTFFNILNLKN